MKYNIKKQINAKIFNIMEDDDTMFIFASDFSRSTIGYTMYHSMAANYLNEFNKTIENSNNFKYLTWGDACVEVSKETLENIYRYKLGKLPATHPQTISKWIKDNNLNTNKINLWLLTDGEINDGDVKICYEENKNITYDSVKYIIINHQKMDFSVGSCFFGKSKIEIIENDKPVLNTDTRNSFNFDEITLDNFDKYFDDMSKHFQIKYMVSNEMALEMLRN